MSNEHEHRIRSRAYDIWQAEGQPEGKESDHWTQAEFEIKEGGETIFQQEASPVQSNDNEGPELGSNETASVPNDGKARAAKNKQARPK